ncbi:MAG: hypothetical protein [Olavius algarvensis spirochete endosymbiont]|nr:MAG: hypothetical protein [Olavius algarvensis spirochete endosymbiont]
MRHRFQLLLIHLQSLMGKSKNQRTPIAISLDLKFLKGMNLSAIIEDISNLQ